MTPQLTTRDTSELVEKILLSGDLKDLTPAERVSHYRAVCTSLGLNPLTKPFEYLNLSGKLTLYALKTATDQLRDNHGVSVTRLNRTPLDVALNTGLYVVTAYAANRLGRRDSSDGAVWIKGLTGEALANALMKAETKAKRRVTLSLCGLGWLDESEAIDTTGYAVQVDEETGEIVDPPKRLGAPAPRPQSQRPAPPVARKAEASDDVLHRNAGHRKVEGEIVGIGGGIEHTTVTIEKQGLRKLFTLGLDLPESLKPGAGHIGGRITAHVRDDTIVCVLSLALPPEQEPAEASVHESFA